MPSCLLSAIAGPLQREKSRLSLAAGKHQTSRFFALHDLTIALPRAKTSTLLKAVALGRDLQAKGDICAVGVRGFRMAD